jgi:hypothetical protein
MRIHPRRQGGGVPAARKSKGALAPITVELAEELVLAHPATGEVIQLATAPDEVLAKVLDESKLLDGRMREFNRLVQDELLARMDAVAKWTIHGEGYTLAGSSPSTSEYDVGRLRQTLDRLCAEGLLSKAAATAAIKTEVSYKAVASGCNALIKLGGEVERQVKACKVPKTRYVRVERTGGD